jgi:hypothetical protein
MVFSHGAVRDRAEACGLELGIRPVVELGGHLVPPDGVARSTLDDAHVIEAEGQQHRLLQPLMHLPLAAGLLGDAGLAGIEKAHGLLHGLAHGARR